jgi:hypothetical protein
MFTCRLKNSLLYLPANSQLSGKILSTFLGIGYLYPTGENISPKHSIRGTGSDRTVGAPRIILRDNTNVTHIQSNNCELWYRNYDSNIQIKDSHISLQYILMNRKQTSWLQFPLVPPKIVKPAIY